MALKGMLVSAAIATTAIEGAAMAAPVQESGAKELGLSEKDYQEFLQSLDSIHETTLSDGDLVAWSIGNYRCGSQVEEQAPVLS